METVRSAEATHTTRCSAEATVQIKKRERLSGRVFEIRFENFDSLAYQGSSKLITAIYKRVEASSLFGAVTVGSPVGEQRCQRIEQQQNALNFKVGSPTSVLLLLAGWSTSISVGNAR